MGVLSASNWRGESVAESDRNGRQSTRARDAIAVWRSGNFCSGGLFSGGRRNASGAVDGRRDAIKSTGGAQCAAHLETGVGDGCETLDSARRFENDADELADDA